MGNVLDRNFNPINGWSSYNIFSGLFRSVILCDMIMCSGFTTLLMISVSLRSSVGENTIDSIIYQSYLLELARKLRDNFSFIIYLKNRQKWV